MLCGRRALLLATSASFATGLCGQSNWFNPHPAVRPAVRAGTSMATDLGSGRILLFGGFGGGNTYHGDTWTWSGGAWTPLLPANAPSARYGHTLVYDVSRSRAVLFGGRTSTALSSETWEWDGTGWLPRHPSVSPQARHNHAMAHDLVRGRSVLYGGYIGIGLGNNETWEWDGTNWTRALPATVPAGFQSHGMAFHLPTQRVVMSGMTETWQWDGVDWLRRWSLQLPGSSISYGLSMCADTARGRIVMTALGPANSMDTWEWDGLDWARRQPTVAVPATSGTAMAAEPGGAPLLFGGYLPGPNSYVDQTWLFTATSSTSDRVGSGCAGSVGTPVLDATLPWLGSPWQLAHTNLPANSAVIANLGLSDTVWNSVPLPAGLGAYGMPGCILYVSPDVSVLRFATGPIALHQVAIPDHAALRGLVVFSQGVVLDAAAPNPTRAAITNAVRGVLAGL